MSAVNTTVEVGDVVNGWGGNYGLAPDGSLARGLNPFGGTWGVQDGKVMLAHHPFSSIYTAPNGRVRFTSTLRLPQ
jgi:hypothetical protein